MEFKKGKKVRVVRDSNNYLKGWGKKQVPFEAVMSNLRTNDDGCYLFDDTISRLVIRLSDCEEIELTLEEVREHFKDAKEVRCLSDGMVWEYRGGDKLKEDYVHGDKKSKSYWDGRGIKLWHNGKFAEIVSYKSEEPTALDAYNKHHQTNYTQDKPARYKSREVNGMDVIDLSEHWGLNFQEANILKYLLRDKGEDEQDMVKIADYAKRELELIKQRKNK